jgi:hypothetical protein
MAEKLKGIKAKVFDIRNNYSGNLYSGIHTLVSRKEENVQAVHVSNGKIISQEPDIGSLLISRRRRYREENES